MIKTSRRSLLTGLISLVAAPAIVRATSLMPVKALPVEPVFEFSGYAGGFTISPALDPAMAALLKARMEEAERVIRVMLELMQNESLPAPPTTST